MAATTTTNHSFCPMPSNHVPTTSTPSTQPSSSPRIMYFITRSNGLPVPLIPADELPFNIKLQNVTRVLTPDQTYGLQYCGNAIYTGLTFKLESNDTIVPSGAVANNLSHLQNQRSTSQPPVDHHRSQSNPYLTPEALSRRDPTLSNRAEAAKSWRRTSPPPTTAPLPESTDSTQSLINAILRTEAGAETAALLNYHPITPPPSGIIPDQEKKEYCTYWILHGDCAYVQQGCRYKHEMPSRAKLAEIGIKNVPRWWLERNAPVLGMRGLGLGGDREKIEIVGEMGRKPEEWLRKDSDTSESEKSESSVSAGSSSVSSVEVKDVKSGGMKSPVVPPTRPPSPEEQLRKTSDGSIDLIQFAPLLPTPSSSTVSTSKPLTPLSSVEMQKRILKKPTTTEATSPTKPAIKTTRIFVPAGESAEKHIAEVKKRERAARNKTSSPSTTPAAEKSSKVTAVVKEVSESREGKENGPKPSGLAASRWAGSEKREATPRPEKHQRTKSGCRPRRPASASPASGKNVEKANE